MALAIDITDGHGLSNKARLEFTVEKEQGNAVLAFFIVVNSHLTSYTLLTRRFKSGHDMRVSKLIKEDWPIVLR